MKDHTASLDETVAGTFRCQAIDARSVRGRDFIWVTLQVLGGPEDGRCVTVGAYVPNDTSGRDAQSDFLWRIRGFMPALKAARAFEQPDDEVISAIASAIIGVIVEADLSIRSHGTWDAVQQLDATRTLR